MREHAPMHEHPRMPPSARIAWIVFAVIARHEEQEALAEFGDGYSDYMTHVPAFIPTHANSLRQRSDHG